MKAIKINGRYILHQHNFFIDRIYNTANVLLKIETVFGVPKEEKDYRFEEFVSFRWSGVQQIGLWDKVKEASSSGAFMELLASNLQKAFKTMADYDEARAKGFEEKLYVTETVGKGSNGDILIARLWEDDPGYQEALERTGQEPELDYVPWERFDEYQEIASNFVIDEVELLYNKVKSIDSLRTFGEVIDL